MVFHEKQAKPPSAFIRSCQIGTVESGPITSDHLEAGRSTELEARVILLTTNLR